MAIVWANENNNNTPWVSAVNQNQSDNQSVSSNSSTSSSIPSKKTWYETQADSSQHPLANEVERLTEKYAEKGQDFTQTQQYQNYQNYLDGVWSHQGGNMGAPDAGYGSGFTVDPTNLAAIEAEKERQDVLNLLGGIGSLNNAEYSNMSQADKINFLKNLNPENLQSGLSSDQYFNFRQQLMNSDVGAYQQAFPWASGQQLGTIMENIAVPFPFKLGAEAISQFAKPVYEGIKPVYEGILDSGQEIKSDALKMIEDVPNISLNTMEDAAEAATQPVDWLAQQIEKLRKRFEG